MVEEENCLSDEENASSADDAAQQCTGVDSRPLSGKYENSVRDNDDGRDIYQGPPTPIR